MDSEYDKICFEKFRLKSFVGSAFEKNRKQCTLKRMADAGFYYTPTDDEPDKVTCYVCRSVKSTWKLNSDDPWLEHQKLNPECFYLEKKKKVKNELTVSEFLLIEKHRFQKLNTDAYMDKKNKIESAIKEFEECDYHVDTIQAKVNEIEKSAVLSVAEGASVATSVQ